MAATINIEQKVSVSGGVMISENVALVPEAYDVFENITLDPAAEDVEIVLQPGAVAALKLFAIKASAYPLDGTTPKLSYKIESDAADPILLGNMHMFCGNGAVASLGAAITKIYASNSDSVARQITVMIARDAVV
jgi:hypothetical protein